MLLRRCFFAFSMLWTGEEATRLIWRGELVDTGRECVIRKGPSSATFKTSSSGVRKYQQILDMQRKVNRG
ncbi:unnamed protein product [Cuscuta campestris]|uniref:Secreted protein n=1 Tax=Cuscuta campestris TaxID=132261 RepID=A0A484NN96_9ASTE|nr:unnamed protein product [Cuscuta campestris]